MDYRVLAPDRLEVLKNTATRQGKYFPYRGFPREFERHAIELGRIADMPAEAMALARRAVWFDPLPAKGKRALEKWIGRRLEDGSDVWWHQFGGQPWLVQGPERIMCPNRACSLSRRRWAMKILAVICNDPPAGLPMVETLRDVKKNRGNFDRWCQVVFHICKGCLTIHAANRCD
jgi:hypothetical protein